MGPDKNCGSWKLPDWTSNPPTHPNWAGYQNLNTCKCMDYIKSRSVASVRLSAHTTWLKTHRQTPYTVTTPQCSLLFSHERSDRWTDGSYQVHIISLLRNATWSPTSQCYMVDKYKKTDILADWLCDRVLAGWTQTIFFHISADLTLWGKPYTCTMN